LAPALDLSAGRGGFFLKKKHDRMNVSNIQF
jgi:hypothetical protein